MYSFYISENIKLVIVEDNEDVYFSNQKVSSDSVLEIKITQSFLLQLFSFFKQALVIPTSFSEELSEREIQILTYMASGLTNSEISNNLNISVHTVKAHIHNIFDKLSVEDRTHAVVKAIKYNLIIL